MKEPPRFGLTLLLALVLAVLMIVLTFYAPRARAEVLAMADRDGVTLLLTNEICHIPSIAMSYPGKVQRLERGSLTYGCYTIAERKYVIAHFPPRLLLMWSNEFFITVKGM